MHFWDRVFLVHFVDIMLTKKHVGGIIKYRIIQLGDENGMLSSIKEQIKKDGHAIVYSKMDKTEFIRLEELLMCENIKTKRVIDDFIMFYPDWRSNSAVEKIMERTKQSLKNSMPELFDEE